MDENNNSQGERLSSSSQEIRPPATDSIEDWEKYLDSVFGKEPGSRPGEIFFSTLAEFGKRKRPEGYDPGTDLYIGHSFNPENDKKLRATDDEDACQCDFRIGCEYALDHPEEFQEFCDEEGIGDEQGEFLGELGADDKDQNEAVVRLRAAFGLV